MEHDKDLILLATIFSVGICFRFLVIKINLLVLYRHEEVPTFRFACFSCTCTDIDFSEISITWFSIDKIGGFVVSAVGTDNVLTRHAGI